MASYPRHTKFRRWIMQAPFDLIFWPTLAFGFAAGWLLHGGW